MFIGELELGAVGDNSRLDGDGSLVRGPDIATQNGARVFVALYSDAHGDVCPETKALFAKFAAES